MDENTINARLLAIIEQAEYAGRQDGIAKATRSSRRAKAAFEMADVSSKWVRKMAADLAKELSA